MMPLRLPLMLMLLSASGPLLADGCELALSRSEIDYGQLNRTTLKALAGTLQLEPRAFDLSVQCAQPQALQLAYAAVAYDLQSYRFADHGHYQLWFSEARLDGLPVQLAQRPAGAIGVIGAGPELALLPEHELLALRAGQPASGQRLSVRVEVRSHASDVALHGPLASEWLAQGRFSSAGAERSLTLRASFTPASCTPRLGQAATADFGHINARQLADQRVTLLQRSLSLQVHCDGPTRFALVAQDNRAGSALRIPGQAPASLFGIGNTLGGDALGAYRLRLTAATANGPLLPVYAAASGLQWLRWASAEAALQHDGQLLGFVRDGEGGEGPSALTDFSAQLQVDLYLAPLRTLRLDQEVMIDGSATLEIIYL